MGIETKMSADGSELQISIDGRFDFSLHQEFRKAYESTDINPEQYVVDMQATTYLDSSALGMLLALRDHAGGDSSDIHIVHCSPDVKKIFVITKLDELFRVE